MRLSGRSSVVVVCAAWWLTACSRVPCDNEASATGAQVRIDVAFGTCNAAPEAKIVVVEGLQVAKKTEVRLDARTSVDVNADPLTYTWSLSGRPPMSTAVIAEPKDAEASFMPDLAGVYQITLVATDGELDSPPRTISVLAKDTAPVAAAGPDVTVTFGSEAVLNGTSSSDPDGDALTYSWSFLTRPNASSVLLTNEQTATPRFVPDARGRYELVLTVSDGELMASDTVLVSAGISASAPVAVVGMNQNVSVNTVVTLDGSGSSDPDGDALTYEWTFTSQPTGGSAVLSDATAAQPTFSPNAPGTYIVQLIVSDGFNRSPPQMTRVRAERRWPGQTFFDPDRIYIQGTLEAGLRGVEVLCDLTEQGTGSVGFERVAQNCQVRATDGRVLCMTTHEDEIHTTLRVFTPDPLAYDDGANAYNYPDDPLANDPVIPIAPCRTATTGSLSDFAINPVTGETLHYCAAPNAPPDSTGWYDESGQAVYMCAIRALGYDGTALCEGNLLDSAGRLHRLPLRDLNPVWAARARPEGGYWHVEYDEPTQRLMRYIVDANGNKQRDRPYGELPPDFRSFADTQAAIDGNGDVWLSTFGELPRAYEDNLIIELRGTEPGRVIFRETVESFCQMHSSYMFGTMSPNF